MSVRTNSILIIFKEEDETAKVIDKNKLRVCILCNAPLKIETAQPKGCAVLLLRDRREDILCE